MAALPVVLLVDDDVDLLESWEMAANGAPLQLQFARSADEALAKASARRPDIVIADYWMPGDLDGIGLLKEVANRWPSARRILMSGAPPVGSDHGHLPNVQVLLKPFSFEELLATLLPTPSGSPS